MVRKINWKRPAPLPLYLIDLIPDFPERARESLGGDIYAPFTARIGVRARNEHRDFGLIIATPAALAEQGSASFKGAIVERYDPPAVRGFVEEVIRSVTAVTWAEATEILAEVMWPKTTESPTETGS